ncbi:MAG: hypothetical protein Q7T50_07985 [Candidatus Magasanikbacteria bacterium]|nr:hypothetical protein [Candidatus Magasanikbacteria bacterium]
MKKIFFLSLIFVFMLSVLPAKAQTQIAAETAEITATQAITENVDSLEIEGVEIDNITKAPSAFGLWWRGVKENISLGVTFDPVKKAEKSIKYAEERMKIAELIAEKSSDPAVQEKAQAMIEKAQAMMEKVEANKGKWMETKDGEGLKRLMNNIAAHQMTKEKAMNRIEEITPEDRKEKFNQLREKSLEASQRMMKAINNENIPAETRAKLEAVQDRIEEHATIIKQYVEDRKELQEKIKAGDETAIEELKQLNEKRKEDLKAGLEQFQEIKGMIKASSTQRIKERIENRIENGATTTKPIIRRIENRIENGTSSGMMIGEVRKASGTMPVNPPMIRR